MKKNIVKVFLLGLLVFVLAACSESDATATDGAEGQTFDFKLSHAANENHPFHKGFTKFSELVKEKSDGRINVTVYPNRQLGDDLENVQNVIDGSVDMAGVSTPVLGSYTPLLEALQLPFLLNTYEIEEKAFATEESQKLLDNISSIGATGIGFYEGGMRHIANNKKEVLTPGDLKGLKLRVVQSDLIADIFSTLGASPTPMAYGEVYSALQTGVIDGEEVNLSTIYAEKHLEVLENVTLAGQFPFPAVLLINNDIYSKLSEEDKKIVKEASDEATAYIFDLIAEMDAEAIEAIKEKGINVVELKDPSEFIEIVQPVYDKYSAKDPLIQDFVDAVNALNNK